MKVIQKVSILCVAVMFATASRSFSQTSAGVDPLAKLTAKAESGDAFAAFALGDKLHRGDGVERDVVAAAKWLARAAAQDMADAEYLLGAFYQNGWGVEEDEKVAVSYYLRAAEHGYASAAYNLAERFANGRGVERDAAEASKWYTKAAEAGDVSAQFQMGMRYTGGIGVTTNFDEAAKWYRKAADRGDASAQFSLAMLYADGVTMPPAGETPLIWFRKAAAQNHLTSQYCLGYRLVHGNGGRTAMKEGVRWLSRAANAGDVSAQCELGAVLFYGVGARQNRREALKWYMVAASLGNGWAIRSVEEVFKGLSPEDATAAARSAQETLSAINPNATLVTLKAAGSPAAAEQSAATPAEIVAGVAKEVPTTPMPEQVKAEAPAEKPAVIEEVSAAEPLAEKTVTEIETLEAQVQASPTNYDLALKLAEVQLREQKSNDAVSTLAHLLDSPPVTKDATLLSAIATTCRQADALAVRERALEKLVKLETKNPDAWYDLAVTRAQLRKDRESVMALKSALNLSKKRLAKDGEAHDILAAARTEACFAHLRELSEFKKVVPANN